MWDELLMPFVELLILEVFTSKIPARKISARLALYDVLTLLPYIGLRVVFVQSYDGFIMLIRILYFTAFCRNRRKIFWSNSLFLSGSLSLICHAIILFYYQMPYLSGYVKQWPFGDMVAVNLLRLLAALALRDTVAEVAQARIEISEYLPVLIACLGYQFDINGFLSGAKTQTSDMDASVMLFMYCFCTTLAVLASFWHVVSRRRQAEVQSMNRILQEQYIMWNQKVERDAAIQRMYHDMKHQIGLIQNLEGETGRELTKALKHSVEQYSSVLDTGDAILNTLLNEKANQCKEKKIEFCCLTNFKSLEPVESLELCAIVGNALENAIEATEKVPEEEKREIRVMIAQKEQFLVFRFENPFVGELRQEKERILTTKENESQHGIGLSSIRYSAEKYGGAVSCEAQNGRFILKVVITVEPKK